VGQLADFGPVQLAPMLGGLGRKRPTGNHRGPEGIAHIADDGNLAIAQFDLFLVIKLPDFMHGSRQRWEPSASAGGASRRLYTRNISLLPGKRIGQVVRSVPQGVRNYKTVNVRYYKTIGYTVLQDPTTFHVTQIALHQRDAL